MKAETRRVLLDVTRDMQAALHSVTGHITLALHLNVTFHRLGSVTACGTVEQWGHCTSAYPSVGVLTSPVPSLFPADYPKHGAEEVPCSKDFDNSSNGRLVKTPIKFYIYLNWLLNSLKSQCLGKHQYCPDQGDCGTRVSHWLWRRWCWWCGVEDGSPLVIWWPLPGPQAVSPRVLPLASTTPHDTPGPRLVLHSLP